MSGENLNLWSLFKKGDKDAFLKIYHSNYEILYSYGFKISGNSDLTRDVIQEIFADLWEKKSTVADVVHIKAYLLKYLRRALLTKITAEKKSQGLNTNEENLFEVSISPEDLLIKNQISKEQERKILDALAQLSPRQREIIYLKFFDELDYQAIQDITSLNYQSLRNTLHKALQSLRKILAIQIIFFLLIINRL